MLADTKALDRIFSEVRHLAPEYRLRLVQRIIRTLVSPTSLPAPQPLRFGEFGGDEAAMSTFEDFAIAEWRPTDEELGRSAHP